MEAEIILWQMVEMFIMMSLGYAAYKGNILSADTNRRLSKLLLNITLPAMILNAVLEQTGPREMVMVGKLFLLGAAMYLAMPVVSLIFVKVQRIPKPQQGIYAFMTTFTNAGFMGFPLIYALYGSEALFYAAILNITFNIAAFSLGVWMIHYGAEKDFAFDLKKILSPGLIFSILAIGVYLVDLQLPQPITEVVATVGNMTTPLAMIIIGSTLATMKREEIFGDWRAYLFAVLKQIVLPLCLWPIICLLLHNPLLRAIVLIIVALPTANFSVMLATEYGLDEKLAAKIIFLTTLLAVITLPLVAYICLE